MKNQPKPEGIIVADWKEAGHHFQIEKLVEPKLVGAGLRKYRLWDNGNPAWGGQWHYNIDGAKWRASYVTDGEYISRIDRLQDRVNVLEREKAEALDRPRTAKSNYEYTAIDTEAVLHRCPAVTTMLYRVCGNNHDKFDEAMRLVRIFVEEALK